MKQAVGFICAGGLKKSREVEKARLEEQKLHVKEEQHNLARLARLGADQPLFAGESDAGHDILDLLLDALTQPRD